MRSDLIKIAKETIEITKNGFYDTPSGKRVFFEEGGCNNRFNVELYPPDVTDALLKDAIVSSKHSKSVQDCKIIIQDADSFEAAATLPSPLVLNFADAHLVGGYFLQGSTVQEESLCRCSTLYGSINTKKARAMYDYNDEKDLPIDTDYMLLSPCVYVFRDKYCELLESPFKVAVATLPAPVYDLALASGLTVEQLGTVIEGRLRRLFAVAVNKGIKNLVLGAWGCGAFGNDPIQVADAFYKLLFIDGYYEYFDVVSFPVKGGGKNLAAFSETFGV